MDSNPSGGDDGGGSCDGDELFNMYIVFSFLIYDL